MFSIIIPANNEEAYLDACLDAVLAQRGAGDDLEIIVAANGCTDRTVEIARARQDAVAARGWRLAVLDIAEGGKPGALNRADAAATPGSARGYLDADVVPDPDLIAQVRAALDSPAPCYASGQLRVARADSPVTRAFARVWVTLPFMTEGVPGAGFFAVNPAGRARWGDFPPIISDDTYVRLLFAPSERHGVAAGYGWPMVEGFSALVRVRRRQDLGVAEIARLYPELMGNEGKGRLGLSGLAARALRMPVAMAVYVAVLATVKLTSGGDAGGWSRGR